MAAGVTLTVEAVPVTTVVPQAAPELHWKVAPLPSLPPAAVKVVALPLQTGFTLAVIAVGAVGAVLTVITKDAQVLVTVLQAVLPIRRTQ